MRSLLSGGLKIAVARRRERYRATILEIKMHLLRIASLSYYA